MSILCIADENELDQRIIKLNLIRYPIFKHVLHFYSGPQLMTYLTENRKVVATAANEEMAVL